MLRVFDDFLANPDAVRNSAIGSGFGSWRPSKGAIGSSVYDGMNFYGDHAAIIEAIYTKAGFVGFPNSMLFRVTNETTERAYVHSDITAGDVTCIVYLSQHADNYGTGFYRHRETGTLFMQPLSELAKDPAAFDRLKLEINDSSEKYWEQVEFVQGKYNRAVVFPSHLWHRRFPEHGFGADIDSGRMIHITHFKNGQIQ
jgi:Family of unknown function (DUF6445)